jgi:carboxyl-terminal processing protease
VKKFLLFALATAVLFCFGFSWRDLQGGHLPSLAPIQQALGMQTTLQQTPVQEFKQAFNRIGTYYYRPVKPLELKYAGISGMMAALGDPHTMFLVPKVAKRFNTDVKANYVGIGARLSPDPLGAKAVTVFEDGPGFAAGLRKGDMIVSVNGDKVAGQDIEQIVEKIQGEEGTLVRLGVLKANKGNSVILTVKRAHVTTPTVESTYFPEYQVGYIAIANFAAPTVEQFDKELEKVERNPLKGLVIDVRGNPGGYVETAVDLLARWKGNKTVIRMKMRDGDENREYTPQGQEHAFRYPVAVLINSESASAAEIFSGNLKDYKLATLVGEHSYGKASVQEVYQIRDGSSAKITIAKYFLPITGDISRQVDEYGTYIKGGLEPDVPVEAKDLTPEEMREAMKDSDSDIANPKLDNQLMKAIQVVLSKSR